MSWKAVFENPKNPATGRGLVITTDPMWGRLLKVRGPAYRMVQPTSDWARIIYEKIADDVLLERPRQSGHEIEGRVRIRGKSYSAFTSGGENPDGGDGMIIVRMK